MKINHIYQGDCMKIMKDFPDKSIHLILSDLPYGVTQHKEDIVLNLEKLWNMYKRILKEKGTIVLTSQFPFTLDLINSNKSWFKYDLIWNKKLVSGFLNANKRPLRIHEHILIFYNKLGTYNPQKRIGKKNHSIGNTTIHNQRNYNNCGRVDNKDKLGNLKHPISIITIQKSHSSKALHRTEKPVQLAEWLIKTYSNKGDIVLDNCIGTGWTAVACKLLSRNYVGIELKKKFVDITNNRLSQKVLIS